MEPGGRAALDRIAASRYSGAAASQFKDAMTGRTLQLEMFPDSGREVPEFRIPAIRELIEGDYRIIYHRLRARVEIIGVIHGRMSLGSLDDEDI
jgi:plasmid stabilization system protein ParE